MNADIERTLWEAIKAGRSPRDVIHEMLVAGTITSGKQAHATLEKWVAQGVYDFGVALDLGWCEPGKTPRRFVSARRPEA